MMDPAKLKVVELRAELTQRGLDAKGNKPVLIERLRKALEEESGDPKTAGDASAQDTNEENVGKEAQKEAREKTPERVPPKTPGRSSRSSSTPSKAVSQRGNPKILLTPLTEKQITPTKSPPAEKQEKPLEKQEKVLEKQEKPSPEKQEKTSPQKQEKTSPQKQEKTSLQKQEKSTPEKQEKKSPLKNEAPPDEAKEAEEPEVDAIQAQSEVEAQSEHLETANEAAKTDKAIAQTVEAEKDEKASENVVEEKTEPESEKSVEETKKPALENEKVVQDVEMEEESIAVAGDVSEDTNVETKDTVAEENVEETENEAIEEAETAQTQAENAEEEFEAPEINDEDKLLEDEPMETNDGNDDNKEDGGSMEIKPKAEENYEKTTEAENTEDSASEEMRDEKPKIEVKQEVDVKSNVKNAVAENEEQDVEMKEVKEEPQEDLEQDSKDRDRKDRKDRKRKRSASPEERHKSPQPSYKDDEPDLKEADVVLSWYDSDLNLLINRDSFLSATAMHNEGFGYIWAGARASYGFTEGKVYYEAKITECCEVNLQDEASPHVLRVGWSVQGTTMQLGEEPLTYGFGGTGKISTGNRFSDYGVPFGKDDVIGCYLDYSCDNNVVMSFTINGKDMGTAFTVSKSVLDGKALFPHMLTKNCTFECNFGQEKSWCEEILEGYVPVGNVDLKQRISGPRRPEKREECEIIMMCGLPAAGKTVWATKYAQDNPEKMYNVLGTNALIEKMKVIGLPRKRNYHGRWEVLIDKCTRCLNKLLDMAATRRRNYILDQTNVYPSAQRRKMRGFYGYKRRAVVLVPTDEEFKIRTTKRTACEGEVAPESAVLEMKANFGAPVVGESFDVIEWVELPEEEAKKLIEKYNKEGKEAGFGQQQASKRPRFERSDNHRESRDSRQSSRDSRDSRDHRDRRNNYPDRSRNSTWRGGSNSGSSGGGGGSSGWRDRQPRPAGGHVRHGGGGYGGPSGGGWRGRGGAGGPPSSYRPVNDRRVAVHDRRTSGSDRNRSTPTRQGGWGPMSSYQSSQQSSGWGGSQSGNWPSSQSQQQAQQGSWGGQPSWGQAQHQSQQQQWGNWKGYGQCTYGQQSSYSQQGYGNGNWGSWNQQYYNQYWGQQQPTGQTSAAGSQAVSATGSTITGNSTTSTGSAYNNYSPAWQGYAQSQSYSFPAESSNTNAQQQK